MRARAESTLHAGLDLTSVMETSDHVLQHCSCIKPLMAAGRRGACGLEAEICSKLHDIDIMMSKVGEGFQQSAVLSIKFDTIPYGISPSNVASSLWGGGGADRESYDAESSREAWRSAKAGRINRCAGELFIDLRIARKSSLRAFEKSLSRLRKSLREPHGASVEGFLWSMKAYFGYSTDELGMPLMRICPSVLGMVFRQNATGPGAAYDELDQAGCP
ncbi:uncharacterized protein MYCFIDRAFT_172005 [Pseudocercospora fijiensis CIRAD86]|uniref:Uncharacterized protein n=1 Tax=Pseudocercospora fijiensis (strain CIRAD86) TaxID=383855 RepID=M3BA69_PSEFD|nr:uncharacterized protein MYCFIDRAFT_172005 [Pseudocercospora fijiensis CIRAD86]EME86222.1 hypothetical protein MYCFIDRAFT_172005 [Pseudocercospora fijiensis CIRAD86]